jgi:acyl-CoA synthetase (AMP-forming)/AMP-acid ligase II
VFGSGGSDAAGDVTQRMTDVVTIGGVLRASAQRHPDKIALIEGETRLSYGALDRAADRFANALLAHGLGAGHTVAMLSPNRADYPVFYFGAARAGCLQAHLSTRYTVGEIRDVATRTGIDAMFVDARLLATLMEARTKLPGLKTVVSLDPSGADGVISLDDFVAGAPETPPDVAIDPQAPFCITFTGGTTGFPKGVLVTQAARVASTKVASEPFQFRPDDVIYLGTPLFHVAGLFSWFTTALYDGCTVVLTREWDPAGLVRLAEREKISVFCMVPTQINGFVAEPTLDPARLPAFRYINHGGSPMPEALLRRLFKLFPKLIVMEHYGQSEIGPACYRPPEHALEKWASVGRPFPTLSLEIRDAEGHALPQGSVGEVTVKADYIFKEYYRDPEQTAEVLGPDGWLKTGDLGFIDPDGYLFLVDRSKDMIISGGENIYPAEIENALYDHAAVAEAAVFGVPDDEWGELPAAHIVLKPGASVSADELIAFLETKIAHHKRLRLVEFVDALPKTAIGKIRKNVIRAPYWKGRGRAI